MIIQIPHHPVIRYHIWCLPTSRKYSHMYHIPASWLTSQWPTVDCAGYHRAWSPLSDTMSSLHVVHICCHWKGQLMQGIGTEWAIHMKKPHANEWHFRILEDVGHSDTLDLNYISTWQSWTPPSPTDYSLLGLSLQITKANAVKIYPTAPAKLLKTYSLAFEITQYRQVMNRNHIHYMVIEN